MFDEHCATGITGQDMHAAAINGIAVDGASEAESFALLRVSADVATCAGRRAGQKVSRAERG